MRKKIAFSRIILVFLLLAVNGLTNFSYSQTLTSGGRRHVLHICPDSMLMAWGANDNGQLGNGYYLTSVVPYAVSPTEKFTAVAAGLAHSLALREDGTVWAWGDNEFGQLGDSTVSDSILPAQILGIAGVTAISSYQEHALAIREDSSLWVWGKNDHGQLGIGTLQDGLWPIRVPNFNVKIVAIATGAYFSMALDTSGKLWAWGDNFDGQLGDTLTQDTVTQPLAVPGMEDSVIAIACGGFHALALKQDGSLWSWGDNDFGALGIGNLDTVNGPQRIQFNNRIVAMSAGDRHSLALDNLGQVWAWGDNEDGRLGDSTTVDTTRPIQIFTPDIAISVHAGHYTSMARLADGRLFSWGLNRDAALGDGSFRDSYFPTKVIGLCETTSTTKDDTVTEVFRILQGDSLRWKAGEIASSIAFSSGKRVWFMGPSILDSLRGDTTIPCTGNTVANWVLIQDSLRGPLYSPTNAPRAPSILPYFRDSFPHDTSYVPGAAYVLDTTIYVMLSAFTSDSPRTFLGTYHATMGIGTVTLLDIERVVPDTIIGIDVGKALILDKPNDLIYLYGTKRDSSNFSPLRPYLARRRLRPPYGNCEYKTRTGWSPSPTEADPISSHVVDSAFSVLAVDGRYALITQYVDPSDPSKSGNAMIALVSDSLWGPFGDERLLYVAPDSFGNPLDSALLASGAVVHEACGQLLVSYNVDLPRPGSCDTNTGRLAETWRPKFLRMPLLQVDPQMQGGPVADFGSTSVGNVVQFYSLGPLSQEVLWDFGDGGTSTLHDPVHVYASPSNYTVTLIATSCSEKSQYSDTIFVPGNSLAMTAYPNPNSGSFTLEAWGLDSSEVTLRVMSLMGQVVFQRTYLPEVGRITQSFPTVEFLPLSGAYILQVLQGENSLERLIVVTH